MLKRRYDDSMPRHNRLQEFRSKQSGLISACLCLAELKNELGSLAPDVLDLLAIAVRNEKWEQNSADDLLLIQKYSTLIATVAQKFLGILDVHQHVREAHKLTSVKLAIQNIATLFYSATKRTFSGSSHSATNTEDDNSSVSSESSFVRVEIEKLLTDEMRKESETREPVAKKARLSLPFNAESPTNATKNVHNAINAEPTDLYKLTDYELQLWLCNFTDLTITQQSRFLMHVLRQISNKE